MRGKTILPMALGAMMLWGNAMAMTFEQPEKIGGGVIWRQAGGGGYAVNGATSNNGDYFTKYKKNNKHGYGKGVATFGSGKDVLYAHYNAYTKNNNVFFGGKEFNNTIPVRSALFGEEIYKISNDEGLTMYLFHTSYDLKEQNWYTLIGKRADGKFVKYFESTDIAKRFFKETVRGFACVDFMVQDNLIIIVYERNTEGKQLGRDNADERGEFRFKWDDAAQWFGVEHVAY